MIKTFNIVWLVLTYNCNNKCNWCYVSPESIKEKSFKRNRINSTLSLLKDLGINRTILIGGEPTLYPDLFYLLEEQQKLRFSTGMVTNGQLLSKKYFSREIKQRGINFLTVSIEGDNSFSHDKITHIKGSYNQAIRGIEVANEEGINVSTNTVITKSNFKSLEKIADSLIKLPIKSIGFNICGPCIGTEKNNRHLLNPRIASSYFQKTYDYIKDNSYIKIRLITPIPLCFFDEKHREDFKKEKIVSGGPCQLSTGKNFVIDYNGDVIPCTHLTGYSFFNVFSENIMDGKSFKEKYNQSGFEFRKSMQRNASSKCNEDKCYEPCSGGCPLFWTVFNPSKEIKGILNK